MADKKVIFKNSLYILGYFILVLVMWYFLSKYFFDTDMIHNFVSKFGFFAPIIFIIMQITQNIIAPISHYPVLLAGGLLFGPVMGFIYNWLGTVIGTFLIILLVRKYGISLVIRMIGQKNYDKYNSFATKLGCYPLFLIYLLPVFPDDEITYLVGLTTLRKRDLFIAIVLGKIGGASLSFVGVDVIGGTAYMVVISAIVLVIGTLYYFHKQIFSFFITLFKKKDKTKKNI